MAVPSSGELKLFKDIWNDEIGGTQGENSLHSASVYAGFSTPDAMSDFYGWSDIDPPSVTTISITSVTYNSMNLRGCVTNTGGENVSRGFYHGTNSANASSNSKYTLAGTAGTGLYCCNRTSLACNRTYYSWAFACNTAGETIASNRCEATTPYPPYTPPQGFVCGYQRSNAQVSGNCPGDSRIYLLNKTGYINPYNSAKVATGTISKNFCFLRSEGTSPSGNCYFYQTGDQTFCLTPNFVARCIKNYSCMCNCIYNYASGCTGNRCVRLEATSAVDYCWGIKLPQCDNNQCMSCSGIGSVSQATFLVCTQWDDRFPIQSRYAGSNYSTEQDYRMDNNAYWDYIAC